MSQLCTLRVRPAERILARRPLLEGHARKALYPPPLTPRNILVSPILLLLLFHYSPAYS